MPLPLLQSGRGKRAALAAVFVGAASAASSSTSWRRQELAAGAAPARIRPEASPAEALVPNRMICKAIPDPA